MSRIIRVSDRDNLIFLVGKRLIAPNLPPLPYFYLGNGWKSILDGARKEVWAMRINESRGCEGLPFWSSVLSHSHLAAAALRPWSLHGNYRPAGALILRPGPGPSPGVLGGRALSQGSDREASLHPS